MYPLQFHPLLRRYLWGGRRLESLGKRLAEGTDYAESWEICDRGAEQSVVRNGPLAGTTLGDLVRGRGQDLLGRHHPQSRFPLLFKFLDANQTLSVQVHPNDVQAARLDPPDLGKSEAWVVLATEPGSLLYVGLKQGFDRAALAREVSRGTCELCLHRFEPRVGDCVFLPAGMVHAIGAGLLIAEIQQSSDVTYRLFDWNRVGTDGLPRPLHVAQALESIDFSQGPGQPERPRPTARPHVNQLVACDKFLLDRWQFSQPVVAGGDGVCHLLAALEGMATFDHELADEPLVAGSMVLLPACLGSLRLVPLKETVLLDAYLP